MYCLFVFVCTPILCYETEYYFYIRIIIILILSMAPNFCTRTKRYQQAIQPMFPQRVEIGFKFMSRLSMTKRGVYNS